jgi:branched-chain amino acid transport system permease protein
MAYSGPSVCGAFDMVVWQLLALAVAAMALPVAVPWLGFVFTVAIGKGLAALGVAMLLRGGLISIGHALYVAIGAYATAFLMLSIGMNELFLLLICATAITMAAGLVIGAFMARYRAIFFAMLNLAISMVFFTLLSKLYHLTGGSDGMRVATPTVLGLTLDRAEFDLILQFSAVALMVAVALLIDRYLKSPLGEALTAIHANEVRLEYLGVSARGVILAAYTISAALAGLGGAITAVAIGHVVPELSYWTFSGQLVLIAVLGGITGVPGAFIGAFFFELVRTFAADFAPDAWNAIVGAALLIVIFFLPQGLYGLLQRVKTRKARL